MPLNVVTDLWLPVFIAVLIVLPALCWPLRVTDTQRKRSEAWRAICVVIAPGAALAGMYIMIVGRPEWPPPGLTERLFFVFIAATLLGGAAALFRRLETMGVMSLLAGVAAVSIALWPMLAVPSETGRAMPVVIIFVSGLLAAMSAVSLAAVDRAGHPVAAAIILAGIGLAVGGALLGSGNLKLGQFGLGLGAAGIVLIIGSVFGRGRSIGNGAPAVVVAILAALLVAANRYATLRPVPAMLFAVPAPAAWAILRGLSRAIRPRRAAIASVIVAALLAGTAVGLAVDLPGKDQTATEDDDGYGS